MSEAADTTVTLGDATFDPVATNDFRLSVEGTSNTGKSNTVAAILEGPGDVQLPTLIIECLGALSTVRHADDRLIVVDAREAEAERANERRTDAEDPIKQLEAEREAITNIQGARDDLVETAATVLQQFGPDEFETVPADMDDQSDALASTRAENERLREQVDYLKAERDVAQSATGESEGSETSGKGATGADTLGVASLTDANLTTLLQYETIQTAADRETAAEQHYGRVLSVLASAGIEQYRSATDVATLLDMSDATVRTVLKGLYTVNVVTREAQGRGHAYALNRDLLEDRIDVAEQQATIAGGPQVAEEGGDR